MKEKRNFVQLTGLQCPGRIVAVGPLCKGGEKKARASEIKLS